MKTMTFPRLFALCLTTAGLTICGPSHSAAAPTPAGKSPAKAPTWQDAVEKADGKIEGMEGSEGQVKVTVPQLTDALLIQMKGDKTIAGLEAYDARKVTLKGLQAIGTLAGLKQLSLTDAPVATVTPLASLKNLETLSLTGAKLSDVATAPLAACSELRDLDLAGSPLTDASFATFKKLERLERLGLSSTNITDRCVSSVAEMKALQYLNVAVTKMTRPGFMKLDGLGNGLKVQY